MSGREATEAEFRDALSKISDIDVGPDRPPLTIRLHGSSALRGRMFMLEDGDNIQWFRIASASEPDADGAVVAVLELVDNR